MTYALYEETEQGLLRIGTFKPHRATSVREIAAQLFAKYPNMPQGKMYIARRFRLFGKWTDDVANRVLLA
jgi:hypothetical protein